MASSSSSFLLLLFPFLLFHSSSPESAEDRAALLDFISKVPHESRIQWNSSTSSCSWVGVQCDANQSRVVSLRLPGAGLVGAVPPGTVGRLTALRVLSLRANRLAGTLPSDLSNLVLLRSLYLQNNVFTGGFPPALPLLTRLTRVDLSGNLFSGEIPFAVNNLTRLTRLFLQSNNFSGHLPSISIPSMRDFDVSDNRLNGSIPASLAHYQPASFAGNVELCGPPLSTPCNPFFTAPSPAPSSPPTIPVQNRHRRRRLSRGAIIAIAVVAAAVLLALLLLLLFCLRRRRSSAEYAAKAAPARTIGAGSSVVAETGTSSSKDEPGGGAGGGDGGAGNKLVFVEGGGYSFDLEDLLRASAEVLGKGSAGTSYKAVLEEGTTVVVKRLKDVAAGRREFEQQMEALGKVKHPNVVPLRAYYFSKDEKLLVSDFMAAGSLSALLHGSRGSGRTPLDWDNRMRIALAAGRGIAHIHAAAGIPHGNIKSSNVLLRPDLDAAVSDFGLAALFSPHAPAHRGAAGYRAPEVVETRKPTLKSDVYSYGVLLLELLTGKSPAAAAVGGGAGGGEGEGIDLPRWVQSVVREEWTAEVFDVELMRYQDIEEEMVQLLQVAMACVATSPDQRPDFAEVLRTVEEMVRPDAEDAGRGPSSSSDKAAGGSAAHTPPASTTP